MSQEQELQALTRTVSDVQFAVNNMLRQFDVMKDRADALHALGLVSTFPLLDKQVGDNVARIERMDRRLEGTTDLVREAIAARDLRNTKLEQQFKDLNDEIRRAKAMARWALGVMAPLLVWGIKEFLTWALPKLLG